MAFHKMETQERKTMFELIRDKITFKKSYIDVNDFPSVSALADYLIHLSQNPVSRSIDQKYLKVALSRKN